MFRNFFGILNGTGKGSPPAGASKVDARTAYDRSDKVVKRFAKGPGGVWRVEP